MTETSTYLDTKQLAKRYGVTDNTVKIWRMKTRKENKQVGPEWYTSMKTAGIDSHVVLTFLFHLKVLTLSVAISKPSKRTNQDIKKEMSLI